MSEATEPAIVEQPEQSESPSEPASQQNECKRSVTVEIPLEQVEQARQRVITSFKQRVRLPGFRPGKAPVSLIENRFESEIRNEVLEVLLPQAFRDRVREDALEVVGTPDITDLTFDTGQPIRFKADFEVAPVVNLGDYRGLPVHYEDPVIADSDLDQRMEQLRESKAEYPNLDPRPIEQHDYVLVHLKSLSGLAEPIEQDVQIQVSGPETLPAFNEALLGATPDAVIEADINYPEDYGQESLAGKTVRFELTPKFIRKMELPTLDDEFARDLGDYQTLDELRTAVRKSMYNERQRSVQRKAQEELIDRLLESHTFAVPEAYVDRQIENQVRSQLRELMGRDVDPAELNLDWGKLRAAQRDQASRNVRASLLIEKVSEREGIRATKEEVDGEVQRIARQEREAIPVARARLEKDGTLGRISSVIQTEKTLQFLFEHSSKQPLEKPTPES